MTSFDHFQPCNASIVLICLDENSTFAISTTIGKSVRCDGSEKQKGHNAGMFQKDKNSNWLYYQNPSCHHVEHFQTYFTPQKSIQTPAFVQTQMRKKRWISTFKIYVPIIISILKLTSPSSQTKHFPRSQSKNEDIILFLC